MRFIWLTAMKDWWRDRRDPVGLLIWIAVPILIGGLITLVSGGKGGVQPHANVFVVDQDQSPVSDLFKNATSQMGGLIETEAVELEAGRRRVNKGEASALLVIPAGFGQAVINEDPTTLTLYTNPAEIILPGIVEETVSILVDATFYAHRVLGEEAKQILSGPGPGGDASGPASMGALVNTIIQRVSADTSPPRHHSYKPARPGRGRGSG